MKGCPLSCEWCSNPESQKVDQEIMTSDKCINCGECIKVCPTEAISFVDGIRKINFSKCDQCLKCTEFCKHEGIVSVAKYYTCDELMMEIKKDKIFYDTSGGGVTFTGGEPLVQWKFLVDVLKNCKDENIHICLDTTGYVSWDILQKIIPYVDIFLYDLKHLDDCSHKEKTGVDNQLILDNLIKIAQKKQVWVRVPIIPGYNDSIEYMKKLADFVIRIGVEKVSLLPYHKYGEQKYNQLGRAYPFKDAVSSSVEHIEELKNYLYNMEINVCVGS